LTAIADPHYFVGNSEEIFKTDILLLQLTQNILTKATVFSVESLVVLTENHQTACTCDRESAYQNCVGE
jgi:hypothetical protein